MKLTIMGAGAMGCLWAAHLHCSDPNKQVRFIDSRPTRNTAPATKISFSVSSPFLPHIPENSVLRFELDSPPANETLECIFVCTKSFDALAGLKNLGRSINEQTIIVLFQNGLGSQYDIVQEFPNNPVYAAVTTEGANRSEPGKITHAGKGVTRVGPLTVNGKAKSAYQRLFKLLQTNSAQTIETQYEEVIWQALWHKLVINCAINPYTALLDCPNGEVKSSKLFADDWPTLRTELSELLRQAEYPLSENEIESLVFDVMHKTRDNISSMLQDVRAAKQTEVADINGFAARFLSAHDISNEINNKLVANILKLSVTS